MKKILLVLVVLVSLFMIPNFKVEALEDSFYEGEYINGEYIKKFKNGSSTGKYEQLQIFRRSSDNEVVYCVQLWETLSSNKILPAYDYKKYDYSDLDRSKWDKVLLISYFGYGYKNHTDIKWYAITQFMIWKITSLDSNIYFTDTLNGNKITKYEREMEEINSLIKSYYQKPSFDNLTFELKYNEEYSITDSNNILNEYTISSHNAKSAYIENNTLKVKKTVPGESSVFLKKIGNKYNRNALIYVDSDGQNLFAPGDFYTILSPVYFKLSSIDVTINKLDLDTNLKIGQGDAKLSGSKFQLLDKNNNIVQEKTINENGTLVFNNVGYGSYFIKEVNPGIGYLLNKNVIPIEVDENVKNVTFYNQVIKNNIIFKKYIRNPITGLTKLESNAEFSIYDSKNNLIKSFKTDDNGSYQLTLPYGNYLLKQTKGIKNHYYIDDLRISITEDNKTQTINLYNEEITANVKVINVDDDSYLPLLESGAKFKIKNLDNDVYIKDQDNNDLVLETNNLGSTNFYLLSSGKYQVEQITSIAGYYLNQDKFIFEITDDTIFKLDENGNKYLEIIVPNLKQTSKVQINKYIENYYDDILIGRKKDTDIIIPIYANYDTYSKDGVMLYQQDEKVANAILSENDVISPNLYFGNYYIINPSGNEKIDILLDSVEKKVIDIILQVYEYTNTNNSKDNLEEKEKPILNNIAAKPNINREELDNNKLIELDKYINVEIIVSKNDEVKDLEENIEITVPNTYTKELKFSYLGYILILIGLNFIRRNKYENK